jgi:hypothetical protein
MDAHENSVNKKPRLCVVCRFEGLIESASWVKGKRDGLQLVIGVQVTDESGGNGHLTHLFSEHPSDQKRLDGLCAALDIDPLSITLDDLVGRRVAVVERALETGPGEACSIITYRAPKKSTFHGHQPTFH